MVWLLLNDTTATMTSLSSVPVGLAIVSEVVSAAPAVAAAPRTATAASTRSGGMVVSDMLVSSTSTTTTQTDRLNSRALGRILGFFALCFNTVLALRFLFIVTISVILLNITYAPMMNGSFSIFFW